MKSEKAGTISALLKEKPRRGRPPRKVSRQNVYVAMTASQKNLLRELANKLAPAVNRADIPDLAIHILDVRLEKLRRLVADRDREMPEGITDLESLFLLWDLPLAEQQQEQKWTSIRLSPQPVIQLGRAQGTLHALFGASRSDVFSLALSLLEVAADTILSGHQFKRLADVQAEISRNYL